MKRPWIAMELEFKWYIPYWIRKIFQRRVDKYFQWREDFPRPLYSRIVSFEVVKKKP